MTINFKEGSCLDVLKDYPDNSFDSCITDPPYGMGMEDWDHTVPGKEFWDEINRVLKPGAFCLSFCSPHLYHRLACAVEDATFEIKDQIMWMITTKMPLKNRLKQVHEPIAVAQKRFKGSIKTNFEKWGVGLIDTQNTRVPWDGKPPTGWVKGGHQRRTFGKDGKTTGTQKEFGKEDANPKGRYPSNIIGTTFPEHQKYFYAPRVTRKERGEYNNHPTPKPVALMQYLIKLYTPEGGTVLDPFCGSGSTAIAAMLEERKFLGIDLDPNYIDIAKRRVEDWK
jgi:site-specific DNA-methyltransferase (adenine-specific)|tara:strand:- start:940 stop:1782 length:843 start_codon:yes stop_codon:yes gene_type:complete